MAFLDADKIRFMQLRRKLETEDRGQRTETQAKTEKHTEKCRLCFLITSHMFWVQFIKYHWWITHNYYQVNTLVRIGDLNGSECQKLFDLSVKN